MMKTGYHYAVRCSDCGETIRIPVQTLEKITQLSSGPVHGKRDCCSRMQFMQTRANSRLLKNDGGSGTLGSLLETLSHFEGWIVTGWLQCEEQTCGTRLALVMKENPNHAARRVEMACELPEL